MSGNICAFPGCRLPIFEASGTASGEVCHIRAQSPGGPRFDDMQSEEARHSFENLILLCRRHHKIVDAEPELYPAAALEDIKAMRENQRGRPEEEQDGFFAKRLLGAMPAAELNNLGGNIVIGSPGAIVAGTIVVRSAGKTPKFYAPAGTIGADREASGYIQYLIRRYNEFASADVSRATRFHHGAVSKNIESRFHSSWRALPMQKWPEVCAYLEERIGRTRVAKSNAGKGHRSFLTFEEFVHETRGS
jgi:hypothetical protein